MLSPKTKNPLFREKNNNKTTYLHSDIAKTTRVTLADVTQQLLTAKQWFGDDKSRLSRRLYLIIGDRVSSRDFPEVNANSETYKRRTKRRIRIRLTHTCRIPLSYEEDAEEKWESATETGSWHHIHNNDRVMMDCLIAAAMRSSDCYANCMPMWIFVRSQRFFQASKSNMC